MSTPERRAELRRLAESVAPEDHLPINVAQLLSLLDELKAAEERAERAEVQLAGCGVAATGWAEDDQKAVRGDYGWSPAYEDVLKLRERSWRCFHCNFFTLDEAEAAAHFGDRDDPEEFKPLCAWWKRMDGGERAATLQDMVRELNGERDYSAQLLDRIAELESRKPEEGRDGSR